MAIFALTSELTSQNGWGRYSMNLLDTLRTDGVESIVATKNNDLPSPFGYAIYFLAPWYAWRLKSRVQEYDAIHSLIEPYAYIAYWLSQFTSKPYFVTAHGTYAVLPYSTRLKRFFHHTAMLNARKIICISEYTKMRLAQFGLNNLSVINNGISFNHFYQPDTSIAQKDFMIMSVGMLKHRKGQHVTIQALAKVKERYPEAKYYIVGDQSDTPYFKTLQKLVSDLALIDSVIFLERISDQELIKLYQEASLFVLTPISYGAHFEGFGLVYLEANAAGLPVVGTSGTGAEDAIQDGQTGLLVPQEDVAKTAEAMLRILEDQSFSAELSQAGISWAREHDWNIVAEKYLNLYRN